MTTPPAHIVHEEQRHLLLLLDASCLPLFSRFRCPRSSAFGTSSSYLMGALCGKEDHFDALERHSSGNRLGAPTSATPASKPANAASGAPKVGKSVSTSPPQRLGGNEGGTGDEAEARRRMLEAAEARNKASAQRGAPSGGKLSKQLAGQAKDGGRVQEGLAEADRREQQLVWD
ncbi:hypothetical protein RTBOTA2_000269 [Rhodotorula toruloides]|nr:hypothetical protein RTBOTA2_000269 [Rhodotorula toruloides]